MDLSTHRAAQAPDQKDARLAVCSYGLPFPVIVAGHQNTAFRTHRRVFVPHHINTLANV